MSVQTAGGGYAEPDEADDLWAAALTGADSTGIRRALARTRAVEADRWAAAIEGYLADLSPNLVWGGDVTRDLRAIVVGLRGDAA